MSKLAGKRLTKRHMRRCKMPWCPEIRLYTDNPEDTYCRMRNLRMKTKEDKEICDNCHMNPDRIEKVFKKEESVWDEN
jgi:hypothetical protein